MALRDCPSICLNHVHPIGSISLLYIKAAFQNPNGNLCSTSGVCVRSFTVSYVNYRQPLSYKCLLMALYSVLHQNSATLGVSSWINQEIRKRLLYYIYNYLSGLRHEISRHLLNFLNGIIQLRKRAKNNLFPMSCEDNPNKSRPWLEEKLLKVL